MATLVKAVLVGDSGVGKTSIYQRLESNIFSSSQMPTVGGSFAKIEVSTSRGPAKIGLWDTAGQERFRTIVPLYFQRASLVLIIFALDSRESFDSVGPWQEMAKAHAPGDARHILVGNKSDVEERAVPFDAAQARADALGMDAYIETSAATGAGRDALLATFERVLEQRGDGEDGERAEPDGGQRDAGVPLARVRGSLQDCC
jgi:small GTP-binding protein